MVQPGAAQRLAASGRCCGPCCASRQEQNREVLYLVEKSRGWPRILVGNDPKGGVEICKVNGFRGEGLLPRLPSRYEGHQTMTNDVDVQLVGGAPGGSCDAEGSKWSSYFFKWLECCSGVNRGCGNNDSTVQPKVEEPVEVDAASVLILAPSDVLHAVRSPFVNVRCPATFLPAQFLPDCCTNPRNGKYPG